MPSLRTTYVARSRLLLLSQLALGALVHRFVPARAARCGADLLVGDDGDGRVVAAVEAGLEQQRHLDDQRARRRVAAGLLGSTHSTTRCPTRGHSCDSSQLRSSSDGEGALGDRGAVDRRRRGDHLVAPALAHRATTSGSAYSSWTTASADRVAAPRRSSAASASDFPAPMPPVRPTNGGRA